MITLSFVLLLTASGALSIFIVPIMSFNLPLDRTASQVALWPLDRLVISEDKSQLRIVGTKGVVPQPQLGRLS